MGTFLLKKLRLITVGKLKERYFKEAVDEYAKRLGRFCDFEIIELRESPDEDVKSECEAIIKSIKGYCVLFDIGGEMLTSEQLSEKTDKAYLSADTVSFIIGSSRGVDDRVREAADLRISFGRATFPHQLFRVMAAEQIYRAFTISEGVKYHK